MITKFAEYTQTSESDEIFEILDLKSIDELEKTANYDGKVMEYLRNLEREDDHIYALINALTAGEYYGPNRNGDYFPESALKRHHPTFVDHGYVYKHHKNKDPKKSMGRVIFSHYNDGMKRVELVVKLKKTHPDVISIVRDIRDGKIIKTSMGCKVPYDICCITNKKAKTRSEYSDYLKYQMGKILSDGRRVYAINDRPRFFDISIVTIPADPVSSFMGVFGGLSKTAHDKRAEEKKNAEIKKKIEGELDWIEEDPSKAILRSQGKLTQKQIEKLSSYPLNETLSTFLALRVLPTREDFQKLALYSIGKKELADELEKTGQVFEVDPYTEPEKVSKIGPDFANEKIAGHLKENISELSLTKPFIINRIIKQASLRDIPGKLLANEKPERSFLKRMFFDEPDVQSTPSGVKNPIIPFTALGTMYAGYAHMFGESANATGFARFVGKHP